VALPRAFYLRSPAVVARALLGCVLVSQRGRTETAGRIVETEAYLGPEDGASHAAFRPGSHALFYGEGGHAYVFVAYGVHLCLNAITGAAGTPGCVLIRALEPRQGIAAMARRREAAPGATRLASGPGNLTRALGITLRDNGVDLTAGAITIEPPDQPPAFRVCTGPRIGITRAVERPLRFWVAGNRFVSGTGRAGQRAKQTPG
jgi:DNA-3-methyladenine glycosylase